MIKSFEEAQNWGKQGFEAYVASATAWTKGMQSIATEVADYSRKSFEEGSAMVEKAVAAKSFDNRWMKNGGIGRSRLRRMVCMLAVVTAGDR